MTHHHALPQQRVTLITLGVTDLARARAFYHALGWTPALDQEGISLSDARCRSGSVRARRSG